MGHAATMAAAMKVDVTAIPSISFSQQRIRRKENLFCRAIDPKHPIAAAKRAIALSKLCGTGCQGQRDGTAVASCLDPAIADLFSHTLCITSDRFITTSPHTHNQIGWPGSAQSPDDGVKPRGGSTVRCAMQQHRKQSTVSAIQRNTCFFR
jgi:hypothetical protein